MKENILILGASGHGKVIADIIEKQKKYNICGFLDTFKKQGQKFLDYSILGSENDLSILIKENRITGCFVAIGDNFTRKTICEKISFKHPNLNFINAIHPNSTIGKNVKLGQGIAVMPGVVIDCDSQIGDFCILNTNSCLGHDGVMYNYSSISCGVTTGGNLKLEECSAVSIGATVIENIVIGRHTIIGAGSLVTKNIPSEVVAYGIPAVVKRSRKKNDKYLYGGKRKKDGCQNPK